MGLYKFELVWHVMGNGGWMARLESVGETLAGTKITRRYAHVNIYPWHIKQIKNKVLVDMQYGAPEHIWRDSIEDAKLYVEAIFALSD